MTYKSFSRIACLLLLGTVLPYGQAQYVHVGPPPPVVEHPYRAPGPNYRWVPGYQRWDGHRYAWTGGRWVLPPRPGAFWVAGHWDRSAYGWRWAPGYWR